MLREGETGTVVVNGTEQPLEPGTRVADLIEALTGAAGARGVAVAVNGRVVPRGRWQLLELGDGDRVEILSAVQGG